MCYWDLTSVNPEESLDMSFVVEDNGNIVGFLKARVEYVYVPVMEVCLIHAVVTDPDYRGQGIGTMLIKELIDSCIHNEINTIRALVDEQNVDLKAFIGNLGFHQSRIINYDKTIEK